MHIYIVCFINGNPQGLKHLDISLAQNLHPHARWPFPASSRLPRTRWFTHQATPMDRTKPCIAKKVRKKCRFFALNMRLPLSLIDWKHHVYQEAVGDVEPLVIQSVNMLRNNEFQEFFALPHGFPWVFHYHIMLHSTCNPRKTLVVSRRQWPSEAGNDEGSLSQHPLSEGSTRIHVIPKLLGGFSPSNWIIIPRVLLVNIKKICLEIHPNWT